MTVVQLPWPDRVLHPNARVHWGRKARAVKAARATAAWMAKAAGIRAVEAEKLKVTAIFCPPDNRRRDQDGMLSSIKAYLDGISDVVGIDDSRWEIAIRRGETRANGAVHVEIEVVA